MKRFLGMVLGALALVLAVQPSAVAAKEVQIGSITYEPKPQRDIINVGAREGQFRAIRMEVRQSDIEVLELTVVYGNGSREDIRVRQRFKAGSSSRVIDLAGNRRAIKQIIVTYEADRPARIVFFGVEGAGGGGGNANWERLSCKEVSFGIDKDTVRVGRNDGTFRAIRLKVRKAPIEIFALRVTFGNGARQDINVRAVIPDGAETRPIDLAGTNRGIDKVELVYRSIPTFKGKAEVCVDGLQR